MNEEKKDLFKEVEDIKQIIDRIEDELISINTTLRFLDVDRFNYLIDKIQEKQERLEVIKDKEEKLKNVYDKLILMINECKGLVSICRSNIKSNKD